MAPLGSHALTVVTLLLLWTFLKLFFWSCLQRHFANHILEKPSQCSLVSTPSLWPLLSSPVLLFFCWLCSPTRLCWSQWPKDAQKAGALAEGLEQELIGHTEAECGRWRILQVQKPSSVGCLPPGSAGSSLHRSKDWILVIAVTRGWGNLKCRYIVYIFLYWKYRNQAKLYCVSTLKLKGLS